MECFKHRPDLELEYDYMSLESPFETDPSSTDPEPLETPELDKTLTTTSDPQIEFNEVEPPVPPKLNRRTTETQVHPNGRLGLINSPVVVSSDALTPKNVKNRRP